MSKKTETPTNARIEFKTSTLLRALELCGHRDAIPTPLVRLQYLSPDAVRIHRFSPDKVSVRVDVPCEVSAPFADTPVPVLDALRVVKTLKRDMLTVTVSVAESDEPILIQAPGVKSKINRGNSDLMSPTVEPFDEKNSQQFDAEQTAGIMRAVKQVAYCISTDNARPVLTGALVCNGACAATDGHRLAHCPHPEAVAGPGFIIPPDTLNMYQPGCSMRLSTRGAVFESDTLLLIGKVVDGTFPNFNQVIPDYAHLESATVSADDLADALRNAMPTVDGKTKRVVIQVDADELTASTNDPDKGETTADTRCNYTGPMRRAGFNHKYIDDVISALRPVSPDIRLVIPDALSPALFTVPGFDKSKDATHIVSPMRL